MFNSQKINNDPKPYVTYANHHRTDVRSWEWDIQSEGGVEYVRVYDPRPEYDNNPNPILESARVAKRQGYLDEFANSFIREAEYQATYYPPTAEVVDHAHKVLTKLVNVYGNKEEQ